MQNILWLVGERVGRAVVTATVLGLVARYLEPAGFGQLNLAIVVVTIGATLATLGLEGVVINELVRRPERSGATLGTAFRLRIAAGVGTSALIALLAFLWPVASTSETRLIGVAALVLFFQPAEVVDLWFQRHLDSRRTVLVRAIALFAGAALKLGLVAHDAPVLAFAWAQVADAAFVALGLAWAARQSPYASGAWSWDRDIARTLLARGFPLAISGFAVGLAMRADQLFVREWLGAANAGVYFAASRLTEVALFLGATMTLSFFPALAESHHRSVAEYERKLQGMFDVLSALGWCVALGGTILGPFVIHLIYGPAYAAAVPVLILQGWACLFALSASARWQFILLSAPTILNLAAALLHLAVLYVAARWLIPTYGITGAAAAWLVAVITSGYLTTYLFPPLRACGKFQTRGLLIPIAPGRWKDLLAQFRR